jgi:hypothetical protein
MKPTLLTHPFHYHLIKDVYTEEELESIWEEIDSFHENDLFLPPEETGAAVDAENKVILKNNSGVWLDQIYEDKAKSPILKYSSRLFQPCILNHPSSWFFRSVRFNSDCTLLSYYDHDDHYKIHNDESYVTICTWLYREPKKFSGGNFYFPEYNIKIPCIHNISVVFPSNIFHLVDKVALEEEDRNKRLGRYCITHFASVNI